MSLLSPLSKKARKALNKYTSHHGYNYPHSFFYCPAGCPYWSKPSEEYNEESLSYLQFSCKSCKVQWYICRECNNQQSSFTTVSKLSRHWKQNCVGSTDSDKQSRKRSSTMAPIAEFQRVPKKHKQRNEQHPIHQLTSGKGQNYHASTKKDTKDHIPISITSFDGISHKVEVLARTPSLNFPYVSNKEYF